MSDLTLLRQSLTPADLRRLGITPALMSDFELFAALERDRQWDDRRSGDDRLDMACYDRRGLLNVLAALVAPEDEGGADPDEAFEEMLAGFDRILHDKDLQQQLLDAGLLVRTGPAPARKGAGVKHLPAR